MAVLIHREKQFNKCLLRLHKAGGRAAGVAERIIAIIDKLASNEHAQLEHVSRLTHYGEARIEKCRKFDLAGGYRLIYLTRGESYYFLFAGTHDECDRWLKNHRDFEPDSLSVELSKPSSVEFPEPDELQSSAEADDNADYDRIILKDLDDKLLRRIFHALCEESSD